MEIIKYKFSNKTLWLRNLYRYILMSTATFFPDNSDKFIRDIDDLHLS